MKRILCIILAAAATLLAASCTKEAGCFGTCSDTVEARFNLGFAGTLTKAFSDGLSATQLIVGVYDRQLGYLSSLSIAPDATGYKNAFSQFQAAYSVRLVKGHGYDIVFLAVAPDNDVYTVDLANKTLTAKTDGPSNVEARDAFYAVCSIDRVTEAAEQNVTLKRPLAQINVITNKADYEVALAAGVTFGKSSLNIKAPKVLNLLDGTVGESVDYSLTPEVMPQSNPDFAPYDANGDYWILTDYILAGSDGGNADVTFGVYAEGENSELYSHSVPNVPLKRNWRTNIVGDVLTVNNNFVLTVVPSFDGEEQPVQL
ncbi:MAG: hypothetical protein J5737_04525 [Bacteroidales bacterium]|nr:hypothetical protein [Bacteroidales bacterium]